VRPKLVATDLDGTLVRSDRTIGPRTIEIFQRLSDSGVPVVLVTGRPIRWLSVVYQQLGLTPLTVCANGATVYDPVADRIVHAGDISVDALATVVTRLRTDFPEVRFAVERDGGRRMFFEPGFAVGPWETSTVSELSAAHLFAEPAAKLLVKDSAAPAELFPAWVAERLAGVAESTNSSSSGMAEVSALGVTKASGLAWVAARFGVDAVDVVAFGDMPNDLPMLGWVGHGVAMANGHPTVLAAAHAITAVGNDDEGVAAYLELLLA
jgi:Cof subfamily protein (haloacid dehalogenase superfamily)